MLDILLVDDHKIMRDGLRAILRQSGEFQVVGEAENGSAAVQLARELKPHLILMDISLPGLNGIEATTEILRHQPDARIVILSMYDDEASVIQAIRSGARAFVLKKASDSDLIEALRTVAKGGSYLSPLVSDRLLTRIQRGNMDAAAGPGASILDTLTPREQQVMRLIAEGKTSKEVAVLLNLGVQTVRSYRKTLMKKLGVNNVAGLTQLALACGLSRGPEPFASPLHPEPPAGGGGA
jgi:DNA-binding NarL/FixJ family response regulator